MSRKDPVNPHVVKTPPYQPKVVTLLGVRARTRGYGRNVGSLHNSPADLALAVRTMEAIPGRETHPELLHPDTEPEVIWCGQVQSVALALAEMKKQFPGREADPEMLSQIAVLPLWSVERALAELGVAFEPKRPRREAGANGANSGVGVKHSALARIASKSRSQSQAKANYFGGGVVKKVVKR